MNGITIGDPTADTPPPNELWRNATDTGRRRMIRFYLYEYDLAGMRVSDTGDITIEWVGEDLTAASRGETVRRMESILRERFGGVYLYLKPQADRNVIRKLRGVNLDGL